MPSERLRLENTGPANVSILKSFKQETGRDSLRLVLGLGQGLMGHGQVLLDVVLASTYLVYLSNFQSEILL